MCLHHVSSPHGHMHKLSSRYVLTPCQIVSWLHSKTQFQLCSYIMSVHLIAICTNLVLGKCLHHVSSSRSHMQKLISSYVLTPCQFISWPHAQTQFQVCAYTMSGHLMATCTILFPGMYLHYVRLSHGYIQKLSSSFVVTPCQFISQPYAQTQFQVRAYTMSVHLIATCTNLFLAMYLHHVSVHLMATCTNLFPGMCLHHVSSSNGHMHKLSSRYILTPCQIVSWLHSKTQFQLCSYIMSVHLIAICTNLVLGKCLHHVSSSHSHMHKLSSRYVLTPCQFISWPYAQTQFQVCAYTMSVHLMATYTNLFPGMYLHYVSSSNTTFKNLVPGKYLHHVSSFHGHMHKLSSRYVLQLCQFISWPHVQTQFQVCTYTLSGHLMATCTNLVPGMYLHHVRLSHGYIQKLSSSFVVTPCQFISQPYAQTQFQVSAYTMSVYLIATCTNLFLAMYLHHVSSSHSHMYNLSSRYVLTLCQVI